MKTSLSLALLALVAAARADVLWDTVYTTQAQDTLRAGTTAANATSGLFYAGQVFKMASAGAYRLDALTFDLINLGSAPLSSQNVQVSLFAAPNVAAFNTSAPVFDSAPIYTFDGAATVALPTGGALPPSSLGVATISGIQGVTLDTSKVYGITIDTRSATGAVPAISYGSAPYVGDPSYTSGGGGWYYDKNIDGALIGTEWGFFPRNAYNQLAFSLKGTAQPVPEPASMVALGLGAVGLIRRRRKG